MKRFWVHVKYKKSPLSDDIGLITFIRNQKDWDAKREIFGINVIVDLKADTGDGYKKWDGKCS